MNKIALAAATISAMLAGAASAADLAPRYNKAPPPVAVFNWTGFYIGAHAGADYRQDSFGYVMDPGTHLSIPANYDAVTAAGNGNFKRTGFIGGGQFGYNWQATGSKVVFGVEADASWVDKSSYAIGGAIPTIPPNTFAIVQANRMNWLSTFRGRIGVTPTDTSLLYVTGGIAVADLRISSTYTDTLSAAVGANAFSGVRAGAAAGAGWEYAFSPDWSLKLVVSV